MIATSDEYSGLCKKYEQAHSSNGSRKGRLDNQRMTKPTVAAIFLIDDNWRVFKEYRDIIGKPLRQEEIDEVEKMLRCKDPGYGFATYVCFICGRQKIIGFSYNGRLCTYCGYRHARKYGASHARWKLFFMLCQNHGVEGKAEWLLRMSSPTASICLISIIGVMS